MVVERSILIRSRLARVWQLFTDLTCWADWNSVLRDVQGAEICIAQGTRFRCCIRPFSVPVTFEPKIDEVVPMQMVVWKGEKFGITARHEYRFEEEEGGVRVTSREVFAGPAVAASGRLFPKAEIEELTVRLLKDLKAAAEKADD